MFIGFKKPSFFPYLSSQTMHSSRYIEPSSLNLECNNRAEPNQLSFWCQNVLVGELCWLFRSPWLMDLFYRILMKNFVLQIKVVVGMCFNKVCKRLKASTCFILVPGRCSIMYSKSCKNMAQRDTFPGTSFFRMVIANALQSVTILIFLPSK